MVELVKDTIDPVVPLIVVEQMEPAVPKVIVLPSATLANALCGRSTSGCMGCR